MVENFSWGPDENLLFGAYLGGTLFSGLPVPLLMAYVMCCLLCSASNPNTIIQVACYAQFHFWAYKS